MRISDDVLRKIRSDLGLNVLFVKGQSIEVKNCWHFYTDGQSVDYLFCEDDDFRNGMNRLFVTVLKYDVVFPGEYVAHEIVERLFRSPRGFLYFVGVTKDSDIESRGGAISSLSIPDNEMRQHKNEACQALFGVSDSRQLDTEKRIRLARKLKSAYNSSSKQIARICGLKYAEVKDILG